MATFTKEEFQTNGFVLNATLQNFVAVTVTISVTLKMPIYFLDKSKCINRLISLSSNALKFNSLQSKPNLDNHSSV